MRHEGANPLVRFIKGQKLEIIKRRERNISAIRAIDLSRTRLPYESSQPNNGILDFRIREDCDNWSEEL